MIQAKTIDGVLLRDMVVAGAALLEKHREAVDALNVFPVPDGDTGTNMSLTMASATREVNQKEYLNAGEAAAAVSKGALKGARGNSGVITSQLLRGFSRALAGVERITPAQFAAALKSGAETAYKAVMKPKEGTILTVARVASEEAAACGKEDVAELWDVVLAAGQKALEFGLSLGELIDLKIENMAQKRREAQPKEEPQAEPQPAAQQEPPKESGMVAVSLGEGFNQIFRDLTVDQVVEGGQTMNPSIEDISEAVGRVNAKVVYVLPNNGNVILAAQQAAELCEDKKVVVIPTKNVAMGIAAAIACQPELSPEQNAARMEEAAQRVRTGTVTYAVRDTDLDDLHIHQGDIIGLYNGKIQTVGNDVQDVTLRLMEAIVTDEDELITVYYGKDTKEDDAQALTDELASRYGDCDVEMQMGGQPLYYYLVSVE